jgi:VanZ family protein
MAPTLPAADRRPAGALAVYAALIAYASLYPFALRAPAPDWAAQLFATRYQTGFDVALNVAAYLPLGLLAARYLATGRNVSRGIALAFVAGLALSGSMEFLQLFVSGRVASATDVAANATGALAGALFNAEPLRSLVIARLLAVRERLFIPGALGDMGLVLLALWLIAQLNPALPFFEAGSIAERVTARTGVISADPSAPWLEGLGAMLSVAGFGLFLSALLREKRGSLRLLLLMLTVALWMKFAMASLALKAHLNAEWMSETRTLGLAAGLAVFLPLRSMGTMARTWSAMALVLAGAVLVKVSGNYSPLDEVLKLFNRPYGQLANFASLTGWLHEVWPLAAVAWLAALFLRRAGDAAGSR